MTTFRMFDLEWATLAEYNNWLCARLDLAEIDVPQVYSVRIGNAGLDGLIRKKTRLHAKVNENHKKITDFYDRISGLPERRVEAAYVLSLMTQYLTLSTILDEQIDRLCALSTLSQYGLPDSDSREIDPEDLPF